MSDINGLFPEGNVAPFRNTGVYPSQLLQQLLHSPSKTISGTQAIEADQIQPASLDLRLGRKAYRVQASFLPGPGKTVMDRVLQLDGLPEIDLTKDTVFEKNYVYVVELLETLKLGAEVFGVANPKSSTGRLDILTRLIADGATEFDRVEAGYEGKLYLEVAPLSFSVVARQGVRLSQLRLQKGVAPMLKNRLTELYGDGQLTGGTEERLPLRDEQLVPVTVDLRGAGPGSIIAYKARKGTSKIDLGRIGYYDPKDFWQAVHADEGGRLQLEKDAFYILATREDVGVPPQLAAEMVPYDSRSGEFRVHYAGFFDPGFGMIDGKAKGSKAVLEVRSYGVPFTIEHGQIVGWLRYAPVANGHATKLYGTDVKSNYQGQGLRLAKHFKGWEVEHASPSPRLRSTMLPSQLD